MEQKEINERIAMAMLKVCALIWEYWTYNPNKGEFKMSELLQGMDGKKRSESKPGMVMIDCDTCKHYDVFCKKMEAVDGMVNYNADECTARMFFPTDGDLRTGFSCEYNLYSVFNIVRAFCRVNGCTSLINKAVFGYDADGRWARLPELKPVKAKKAKAKPKAKVAKPVKAEPTMADRLRAALLKMQEKQAA